MKMRMLLMIGVAVALVALAGVGFAAGPLTTLLLAGLLLLCPLMMLGMHGGGHDDGAQGADGKDVNEPDHFGQAR